MYILSSKRNYLYYYSHRDFNYICDANNNSKIDGEIIKFDENGNLI
jgi:hypothetical protein